MTRLLEVVSRLVALPCFIFRLLLTALLLTSTCRLYFSALFILDVSDDYVGPRDTLVCGIPYEISFVSVPCSFAVVSSTVA